MKVKRIVLGCIVGLCVLSLPAFALQDHNSPKAETECCCQECVCEDCSCETDCSECKGCRRYEACRDCRDCDHDGYCCDEDRPARRHHRGGCCHGGR